MIHTPLSHLAHLEQPPLPSSEYIFTSSLEVEPFQRSLTLIAWLTFPLLCLNPVPVQLYLLSHLFATTGLNA